MKQLSTPQREAIRAIHDAGETPAVVNGSTIKALHTRGLIEWDAEKLRYRLTLRGTGEYRRIMASGDGPEALKELLRF